MNQDADIVYLNGAFLPVTDAKVSVMDRGFLFADGVYEVIPVYGGRLFRVENHLQRFDQSLSGIRVKNPLSHRRWIDILQTLVQKSGGGDQSLYIQVTRGVGPTREHAFPADTVPTAFAMSQYLPPTPEKLLSEGITAVTMGDIRWTRCDIKSVALLPNVLQRQLALDAGAAEAILVRTEEVTEGTASNVFIVEGEEVVTPPKSQLLLPGITRDLVLELCIANAIPCRESPITVSQLRGADEVWITSSSREIIAVTNLDGKPVKDGAPGPICRQVLKIYRDYKEAFRTGRV